MNIDFANLKIAYQSHKDEFDKAIENVIKNASYIMGPEIALLEKTLSEYSNVKHSISCSSGTDALLLAMMSIDIKPGDEVITSPFTFGATAETIALLGAKPIFADIDEKTYNLDYKQIENKITTKTRAIIAVSLFGQSADMDEINAIAEKHQLPVIEDAAQSFGATYKGRKSCALSTLSCTSFFPAKPLGCFGDGGAVFTNNQDLAEKLKSLRLHGQTNKHTHKYIGLGARMDTIQAAVLLVKLKHYSKDLQKRQKVADKYFKLLGDSVCVPFIKPQNTSVWAQFAIRVKNRNTIQQKLKEKGIPTAVYYPTPLHLQECFGYLNYKLGNFPVSEKMSKEILSLPLNPYIKIEEQEFIVYELKKIL